MIASLPLFRKIEDNNNMKHETIKGSPLSHPKMTILLMVTLFLTSCMSVEKYSAYVNEKVVADTVTTAQENWLVINGISDGIPNRFDQTKSSFVPAILYWSWNYTIECELSKDLTSQYLKNAIYRAADSLNLEARMDGRKLTIDLQQVPGKFIYESKGSTIIFIIAYTMSVVEAITPFSIPLQFRYQISQDGSMVQQGEGIVPNGEQPIRNQWKSTKKFTWVYLDAYKRETQRMGTEIVKLLMDEVEKNGF